MLTVNELFSGIGSQRAALERLGIKHKVVGIAEIDKFAIKSYEAIWGETKNYGDIGKVKKLDYADFWTYSFPCQDISIAGKQEGIKKGKTRSGLLYEVERLLEKSKECGELPKYLMLENVKNLVGKKFKPKFEEWILRLGELGYNTYWKVLNAKNYGIPQNRERVFGVSIRKDVDTGYVFPEPFELKTRLKDILEDEVDEKFYLSEEYTKRFAKSIKSDKFPFGNEYKVVGTTKAETERMGTNSRHWVYDANDCMSTLDATMYKQPKQILEPSINQIGMLDIKGNEQIRRVYGDNGLSPTLNSMQGGNRQPKVLIPQATEQRLEINQNGTSNTITTVQKDNYVLEPNVLTPKRTEYGKAIRKDYENGLIRESRHNMTEMRPREDGISNTLTTVQKDNYVVEPQIQKVDIPQTVTVRKYEVDRNLLCECLRDHKSNSNFSNKEIAEQLDRPITLVEHWFRRDKSFSIPDADIWYELKRLLKIETDEFDLPITEFIQQEGVYEKANRCYMTNGISPTLTSTSADEKIIEDYRIRKLTPKECWRLMGFRDEQFYRAAYGHDIPVEYVKKLHNRTLTKKEYRAYHRLTRKQEVSNSQLYKQAGNSIVVDVLYYLFKNLFIDRPTEKTEPESELLGQMSIMDYL